MKPLLGVVALAFVVVLLAAGVGRLYYARTATASNACVNNLRLIASAKDQWALERHKTTNDLPKWDDLRPYVGFGPNNLLPRCPSGGTYTIGRVGDAPTCSIGRRDHTLPPP